MVKFIVRRIFWTIPVLLVVIFLTFIMMRQIPGNPFRQTERAGAGSGAAQPRAQVQPRQALVRAVPAATSRASRRSTSALRSSIRGRDVNDIVKTHFPKSIELGVYAFLFAIVVGVPLGMVAALRQNTWVDYSAMMFSNIFHALPSFLLATLMIYFIALKANVLPTSGWTSWEHKILPSIALGFAPMALFARLVRGTMLETLQQDYVRTARAKGLRYRRVVGLHVLRNSLIPVVTAAGPLLGYIITGSFVIELIFNIPGIGQYFVTVGNGARLLGRDGADGAALGSDHLREPGRRHPLRDPRPAHPGRSYLMVAHGAPARAHRRRVRHARVRRSASRTSGATRGAATSATRAPWSPARSSFWWCSIACSRRSSRPTIPNEVNFADANLNPSLEHPFGTDKFGRDLFTRTALGGRVSILIAFGATFAILAIGVVYGSISGFVGGRLDNGLMRFLDALYGLPYLPFAIITLAIIGYTNKWSMMIALSIASWFTTARIVRGQVMTLKENDYVRAAKAVGARWYRILGRHLLPNTLGILIIAIFLELPAVILGEAFLSFIGLGISPPDASWGSMAREGRDVYRTHPIAIIIPSVAIATLVMCANFIADGLRDALDPRTKET